MKHLISHVYLDMDGVVTNFILETKDKREDKDKWNKTLFPDFVRRNGFLHLKPMPDYRKLVDYLEEKGVKVTFLTSAGNVSDDLYPSVKSQKTEWRKKYHLTWPIIVVKKKEDKKEYANKFSLLIDDQAVNCDDFEKFGGWSIQHKSAEDTIKNLEEKFSLKRVDSKKD